MCILQQAVKRKEGSSVVIYTKSDAQVIIDKQLKFDSFTRYRLTDQLEFLIMIGCHGKELCQQNVEQWEQMLQGRYVVSAANSNSLANENTGYTL